MSRGWPAPTLLFTWNLKWLWASVKKLLKGNASLPHHTCCSQPEWPQVDISPSIYSRCLNGSSAAKRMVENTHQPGGGSTAVLLLFMVEDASVHDEQNYLWQIWYSCWESDHTRWQDWYVHISIAQHQCLRNTALIKSECITEGDTSRELIVVLVMRCSR